MGTAYMSLDIHTIFLLEFLFNDLLLHFFSYPCHRNKARGNTKKYTCGNVDYKKGKRMETKKKRKNLR